MHRGLFCQSAREESLDTETVLIAIARRLDKLGHALVLLDIESDCYAVAILEKPHVREAIASAKAAGFRIRNMVRR